MAGATNQTFVSISNIMKQPMASPEIYPKLPKDRQYYRLQQISESKINSLKYLISKAIEDKE